MLPALASLAQLAVRLDLEPDELDDDARAAAVLEDASAAVRAAADGTSWVDENNTLVDVPDRVVTVTLAVALRAYQNPTGATQKTAGDASISYGARSGSAVYLTREERRDVRRAAGISGMSSTWVESASQPSPRDPADSILHEPWDPNEVLA